MAYYTKKIIEHFLHPQNFGKIKDANAIGNTNNIRCGDIMKIYIKVEEEEIIKDIKFETLGCGHAIAISDMLCDLVKGKTIEEASKIGFRNIAKEVGPIPQFKVHCCMLAEKSLKAAIKDYYKRRK